ncbi:MAG: SDR family NAD(P)-dependent oxidoreductase [Acidobacteria bacterium]|nr:SDR family NAD(P)-dependent oxidoreductase [Acidobacteriota bacterium]
MNLLKGRVAIVTGAGGGLGRAHALLLAEEGAAVLVNDIGGDLRGFGGSHRAADRVAEEIRDAGGRADVSYESVTSVEGGRRIVNKAIDAFGGADILVNNAGILRDRTLVKLEESDWDPVLEVHLKGTYCVSRPMFAYLKERGAGGVIVNTSSASGLFGNFGQTNYGAAKAGIAGFTRCLALEGKKYGIRVWGLVPVAATRMTGEIGAMDDLRARLDPARVSPAVLYMVSDLSKGKTGRFLFAGGGRVVEIRVVPTAGLTVDGDLTAALIAEREEEIFAPEESWSLFDMTRVTEST